MAERKLSGLRAARRGLHDAYDALVARASATASPSEELRTLAEGLRDLRLGSHALHPALPDVRVVAEGGDEALVERWLVTLRTEMRRGRARADLLPLVAGVLGEASRPDRRLPRPDPGAVAAELDAWCRPAPGGTLVREALAAVDPERLARSRAWVGASLADAADPPRVVPNPDLLAPEHRAEGEAWSRSEWHSKNNTPDPEIADLWGALRLWWAEIGDWDWPAGTPLTPAWTRTRWRLRPTTDWLGGWAVQAIGDHLDRALRRIAGRDRADRVLRVERLEGLGAPEVLLANERRMRDETCDLFGMFLDPEPAEEGAPTGGVARARLGATAFGADTGYGYDGGSEIARATARLGAEVELAKAHGRGLVVVKSDIAHFYPSVSHDLVRDLLSGVGVPDPWRALALRALSVPLPDGRRTARGLPLGLALSRTVGDLLMAVLVGRVRAAEPGVDVMALVDDVVFLAPDRPAAERAWSAWTEAVRAAGLAVNDAKSGSVELGGGGGPVPGPVRWGLLRLDADGVLRVDDDGMRDHRALTARLLDETGSVLDRVSTLRDQLRWMLTWLAPQARLDPGHPERVREAVAAWWRGFEPEAALLRELSTRFLDGAEPNVPRAWLHWPVTAGGLGLPWWPADLVPFSFADADAVGAALPGPPAPVDDPESDAAWGAWFAGRLEPRSAVEPRENEHDRVLRDRFVQRAQRLGRTPIPLSTYWRWVLQSHGPEILDAFGTWDFVPTDLVPVELLRGR